MKNKQIWGIVVAGIVLCVVCGSGMFMNHLFGKSMSSTFDSISKMGMGDVTKLPLSPYIGRVDVDGEITSSNSATSVFGETIGYSHQDTLDYIDKMMEDNNNKGIMICVNSPGGGVYESDELYLKLMEYKEETERPIWAFFESYACSGGYYIAMAADKIVANRNCTTGSIGVILSTVNTTELYKKIGVEAVNITSGKNKAMGGMGTTLTEEQIKILQTEVDEAYGQFVGIVAMGRNADIEQIKKLADGRTYTAKQALENGLIDGLGNKEDFDTEMMNEIDGKVTIYEPDFSEDNIFSSLFTMWQVAKPKSELQIMTEQLEIQGNGVLKYYAQP